MYDAGNLAAEINGYFDNDDEIVDLDAMRDEIIARNRDDVEFVEYWLRRALDFETRKKEREFKVGANNNDPRQLALPLEGYHYIQRRYSCKRGGRRLSIPILQMTRGECELHRHAVRKMQRGCEAHGDEWDRFIAEQFGPPVAEAAE